MHFFNKEKAAEVERRQIGVAYECCSRTANNSNISFNLYNVWQVQDTLIFKYNSTMGKFNCGYVYQMDAFHKEEKNLREKGYLTRNEWLINWEKERTKQYDFDCLAESMMQSSKLSSLGPIDREKAFLIFQIVKALGYFNIEDIRILLTIAYEMEEGERDASFIVSIATFLTQTSQANIEVAETDLGQKQKTKGKIISFPSPNKF